MPDREMKALIRQQRKEALEELQRHWLVVGRLKRLIQEHHTYETEAFSQYDKGGSMAYHQNKDEHTLGVSQPASSVL